MILNCTRWVLSVLAWFEKEAYLATGIATFHTRETGDWRRSGIFIVNFEHISHLVSIVSNFE